MGEEFFRLDEVPDIKMAEELEARVIKTVVLKESNKLPNERSYCGSDHDCACDRHKGCTSYGCTRYP